jgi:hypothetical protein
MKPKLDFISNLSKTDRHTKTRTCREILPHLRTETDLVSETLRSLVFYRIPDEVQKPTDPLVALPLMIFSNIRIYDFAALLINSVNLSSKFE